MNAATSLYIILPKSITFSKILRSQIELSSRANLSMKILLESRPGKKYKI